MGHRSRGRSGPEPTSAVAEPRRFQSRNSTASTVKPQALLVASLVAVIALLGAALLRAQRQISALRLNNAALLQATLPRSQTGIDEVPEVEASEPALLSNKDNQTQLLTNLLAENAMLRQRLELIQRQASSVAANSNPP